MKIDAESAAAALVRDHSEKRNITPFTREFGATDLAGAYAIQAAYDKRLDATHDHQQIVLSTPA